MNNKTPQAIKSFKTKLSYKEFDEVSEKVIDDLELKNNYNRYKVGLRSIAFRKGLLKLKAIYKGDSIEVFNTNFFKGFVNKEKLSNLTNVFIERFKKFEEQHSKSLKQEQNIDESFEDWAGYEIPKALPPLRNIQKRIFPLILTSIIAALLIGFLWTILRISLNIIPLPEVIAIVIIIFALRIGIKKSNYNTYSLIRVVLFGIIILSAFLNEYFQFMYYTNSTNRGTVLDFVNLKLNRGIMIEDIYFGKTGLITLSLIRIIFIYYLVSQYIYVKVYRKKNQHIPSEVDDFVRYNLLIGKTDTEVRSALFEKGWTKKEEQNEVFKSME